MSNSLTNRELYIKSIFIPEQKSLKKEYLPESKVYEIIKQISSIGERYGFIGYEENKNQEKSSKRKHKYDVWIAKEIKKDLTLLDEFVKIRFILDWTIQTKSNIFLYSFNEAFELQKKWHEEQFKIHNIEELNIPKIDNDRVLYRCSNNSHFIYLLNENDLKYEGQAMGTCVGGSNYKLKVKKENSIIISLRDKNNEPHVTTEIDVDRGEIIQSLGKGNKEPKQEYQIMIAEFILFATKYNNFKNLEIIRLLNLNQTI